MPLERELTSSSARWNAVKAAEEAAWQRWQVAQVARDEAWQLWRRKEAQVEEARRAWQLTRKALRAFLFPDESSR